MGGNRECVMASNTPPVTSQAPTANHVTAYDEAHVVLYLRLLDALAAGATEADICKDLLGLRGGPEDAHSRAILESHIVRARWMTEHGYRAFLK